MSNGLGSVSTKTLENLPQGGTTYGIWEYVQYLDDVIYTSWTTAASMNQWGLTGGLMVTALATKAIFMPF